MVSGFLDWEFQDKKEGWDFFELYKFGLKPYPLFSR